MHFKVVDVVTAPLLPQMSLASVYTLEHPKIKSELALMPYSYRKTSN